MFTVYIRWFWAKWGFISCFTSVWVCPAASFSCLEQEEKGHCLQWVWLRVSMENIIHRALAWAVGSAPILLFACLCVWSFRKSGSTSGRLSTHPWGPTKTHSVVTQGILSFSDSWAQYPVYSSPPISLLKVPFGTLFSIFGEATTLPGTINLYLFL